MTIIAVSLFSKYYHELIIYLPKVLSLISADDAHIEPPAETTLHLIGSCSICGFHYQGIIYTRWYVHFLIPLVI